MRSTYNNNNNDDDDDFAPNPFRSGGITATGSIDFFETPTTTNSPMNYSQPDPNTGMVGNVIVPSQQQPQQQQQYYPQQQPATYSTPYLTGTMDNNNNNNKSQNPPVTNSNNNSNNNMLYSFFTSCCLPYETIQSLFDIDTIDIYIRIKATLFHFHQPNYFRLQILGTKRSSNSTLADDDDNNSNNMDGITTNHHQNHKGPDLYGPIWISMTCMFLLGITANINDYYRHVQQHNRYHNNNSSSNNTNNNNNETIEEEFEYDLTHLLNAMYICFFYTFGISTFFWLVCICMGFNNGQHSSSNNNSNTTNNNSKYLSWTYWVCHYGYSLVPILIGTCVAWILPYTLFHWIVLGTATFTSSLFIIRNLSTPLLEQEMTNDPTTNNNGTFTNNNTTTTTTSTHAKAAPILLSILGVHFTFLLVLKLTFYP